MKTGTQKSVIINRYEPAKYHKPQGKTQVEKAVLPKQGGNMAKSG